MTSAVMFTSETYDEEGSPWFSAEGYSPLIGTDLQMMAVMDGDEDGDVCNQDGLVLKSVTTHASPTEDDLLWDSVPTHSEKDSYNDLATKALEALEADYFATIKLDNEQARIPSTRAMELNESFDLGLELPNSEESLSSAVPEQTSDRFDVNQHALDSISQIVNEKSAASVDTDRVKSAMSLIESKNPKIKTSFLEWDLAQREKSARQSIRANRHAIIPQQALAAFLKDTPKAKGATARMSRSATVAEALVRLHILDQHVFDETWTLRIHIIGCDFVECETDGRIMELFQPLARWLGALTRGPTSLEIELIGPAINTSQRKAVNLMSVGSKRLAEAVATCHSGLYEEWMSSHSESIPDLVIAFNAGIWGYSDWSCTVRDMVSYQRKIPFVVTAYTFLEAEEDYEVIQEQLMSALDCTKEDSLNRSLWPPQINPFSNRTDRPTKSAAPGQRYRENQAWQAWRI